MTTPKTKIAKLTGSIEMDQALDRMAQAVNDGFAGGKVSRHDLVSWIVLYFEKESFQGSVEKIREDHFDQVMYLQSVLREAKRAQKAGATSEAIAALLTPVPGFVPRSASVRRKKAGVSANLTVP